MRDLNLLIGVTILSCLSLVPVGEAQSKSETKPNLGLSEIDNTIIRGRAAEAVLWGMAAVNTDLMLQAAKKAGADENEVVFWSKPPDWRNQTLTPNPDAIYFMVFFNTKGGPVVFDVPPASSEGSFTGNIDDVWQTALEDIGPSGIDKGIGGKLVITPPGFTGKVPDGLIALPSRTYSGYALIRSALLSHSEDDIAKAVAYGKKLKIYPLEKVATPPATKFTDATDKLFDATIPYDIGFFHSLARVIEEQPWIERDKAMIDPLKSLGIEKGKPFNPDTSVEALLSAGAKDAHRWLDRRLDTAFEPYFPGTHWAVPASPDLVKAGSNGYSDPDTYPIDARALTYSIGYVGIKRLGAGQFYLLSGRDKNGNALDGGRRYRLHVPANVPAQQYWSVTAYSRQTHGLIKGVDRASRSSQVSGLIKNADGSVDIVFGPKPEKGKEPNWVPTKIGERFELLFRLYAPTTPLFEKTWVLPDIQLIQ